MNVTIGILAHVDAGKTTLSECILYEQNVIRAMGRVDKGDSFFDSDNMERQRGITIFSKQAVFDLEDDIHVTLLDTPGHADFSPEAERTLWVMDAAILVISAKDGASGRPKLLFELLERYRVPVFTFVNKMDQPGADKEEVFNELRTKLSDCFVDFTRDGSEEFYEDVAQNDEELLDRYLSGENPSEEEIAGLIRARKIFPVFFGSALKNEGVKELLKGIALYTKYWEGEGRAATSEEGGDNEFSARVFKITRDPQGNRLTHMKITGGRLRIRDSVFTGEQQEKVTGIRIYNGDKFEAVTETDSKSGNIYAVLGFNDTKGGRGLGGQEDAPTAAFVPIMTYRLIPPSGVDALREMMPKLMEICEFMPELKAAWDEERREIHVSIMGSVQLEILQQVIRDRYDMEVTFGPGSIVYRETVSNIVEGVGHFEPLRHYAEVHLKIEPADRGAGITTELDTSVDELALNWQRLIETHILEREHRGVLTGSPITDIKFTVIGGKAHLKHTEGGDFRQATYRAIRQGLMQASCVLLEPYYEFTVSVPTGIAGRVMTDLTGRGASFSAPEISGDSSIIKGRAPAVTMYDYPSALAAASGGAGHISMEFSGYDLCHNTEEVIEKTGYDPTLDVRNSPDSVFCSHGAGTVIPWDDVFDHMHVPRKLDFDENGNFSGMIYVDEAERLAKEGERVRRMQQSRLTDHGSGPFMGYEEVDEIVARASSSNMKKPASGNAGWKKLKKDAGNSGAQTRVYKAPPQKPPFMLIDGYNLIHSLPDLKALVATNLDAARGALLDLISNYRGMCGFDILVVFDAYNVKGPGRETERYGGNIFVVYTPFAQSADAYIEKYVHENASKYAITVVTSDLLEQVIVRGAGCALLSCADFEYELKQLEEEISRFT